ncbi:olfactory receptor 5V1-like [Alligator sinensis]|uniref:Olfactory receptor n=1 Tax=Alligator sinensis TaxID=38654 RepID=A0A1U7SPD6_ALLSI|nr:olfactory receptor 5V1-like [Alligator sinensis]
MVPENQTTVREFILLGLSTSPSVQIFLFLVFLIIYIITLLGNVVIMLVIRTDPHLHTPMYFFLSNLSFLDICYSSVTVPKMLVNFLVERKTISLSGCTTQLFFVIFFIVAEGLLLSVMAYDRYAAICHPLHYTTIMKQWVHVQLACSAWITAFIYAFPNTLLLMRLHFCGPNIINHFSCEPPQVFMLSCSDPFANQMVVYTVGITLGLLAFLITLSSYVNIISTILKMSSVEGKHKAFSTCTSHLIVLILFYGSVMVKYLKPTTSHSQDRDKFISLAYSIFTPMLNPIIYSLRNQEVKKAVLKILSRTVKDGMV